MVDYFVMPHLGLGDQLIMNGFVHFLRRELKANKIMILAKEPHSETLRDLYSGFTDVNFLTVTGDEEIWGPNPEPFRAALRKVTEMGYKTLPFGVFSGNNGYLKLDPCWANCFYAQHKLPSQIRWDYFTLPEDMSKAEKLYKKLTDRIGKKYVVIHDDPSRKLTIDTVSIKAWLTENKLLDYPCIYLGEDRYKSPVYQFTMNPNCKDILKVSSIIDYVTILQNATAAHMIDSSLAILLDLSYDAKKNPDQKRVSYIRYSAFPTKGLYKNEWTYVE
jgi:hypothetical protein